MRSSERRAAILDFARSHMPEGARIRDYPNDHDHLEVGFKRRGLIVGVDTETGEVVVYYPNVRDSSPVAVRAFHEELGAAIDFAEEIETLAGNLSAEELRP